MARIPAGSPARSTARRTGRVAVAALLGGAVLATGAAPAAADYAYWSYWRKAPGSATWVYSNLGPAFDTVRDGSVEGWHFVVGQGGPGDPPPAAAGDYAALCPRLPASRPGSQVALVLDFGPARPEQLDCLTVPAGASGADVLTAAGAAPGYASSGLLCSLEAYPPDGCGQPVPSPTPSARPSPVPTHHRGPPPVTGSPSGATGGVGRSGGAVRPEHTRSATATAGRGSGGPLAATTGPAAAPSAAASFAPVADPGRPAGGFPVGLVVGLAAAAALAAGAVGLERRRRRS